MEEEIGSYICQLVPHFLKNHFDVLVSTCTLKDFKIAKKEIHKIY